MGITVEGFPCHSVLFCLLQIVDMARQRVVAVEVFYLLSPRPAHLAKRFVLLHARKPASAEIGGYPRRGAAAEGIEYPVALIGRGAENGGYPPTQNGDIRSLFWLFSLMALQN